MFEKTLLAAVESGAIPGAVAMAGTAARTTLEVAAGVRGIIERAAPMTTDTLFRLRSMTKAVTAAAAMQMVEQGRLSLDQDMGKMIPELAAPMVLEGFDAAGNAKLRPARGTITLRHLLTHTAGLTYDMWNANTDRYMALHGIPRPASGKRSAFSTPLAFDPGTDWQYSIGIDFAGLAVEEASGKNLDQYLRDHIFGPLGMDDTGFLPDPLQLARLATQHNRGADGTLSAVPLETPQRPQMFGGGGGLFGTAPDYMRFLRMLLNGGTLDGEQVLKPETVALMGQNHIGALSVRKLTTAKPALTNDVDLFPGMRKTWGLSFLINEEQTPEGRSPGSLFWAGLCNTYYVVDPKRGTAVILMTQILPFADPAVLGLLSELEREIYGSK